MEERNLTAMMLHRKCMFLHLDHGAENIRVTAVSQYLTTVVTTANRIFYLMTSQWIDSAALSNVICELKSLASNLKRMILLISGSYLEDLVTVCSLEGFNAQLLCNMIWAGDVEQKAVLFSRLV
jgi:hypothetical protein